MSLKYLPALQVDVAGWGSTVDAGPRPYRFIPVQVVPPGDVETVSFVLNILLIIINLIIIQTGEDAETLRIIESHIQANFANGLPPHLQVNAKTLEYLPGSDQSRIFVSSHGEFSSLRARDIQTILRRRLILVHGVPIDYNYGWDLESIDRLYDVDKKTNTHG